MVMVQGHKLKREFVKPHVVETQVICGSNMVDDMIDSFSFGDGAISSKQSTNAILDPENITRKGRLSSKRKQSYVEKTVTKKMQAIKKKNLTPKKAVVPNEKIKNNGCNMGAFIWPNIGLFLWPNVQGHYSHSPPNLMPDMQSIIRGGPSFLGNNEKLNNESEYNTSLVD